MKFKVALDDPILLHYKVEIVNLVKYSVIESDHKKIMIQTSLRVKTETF